MTSPAHGKLLDDCDHGRSALAESLDVVLQCFARTVGATTAAIVCPGDEGPCLLAAWAAPRHEPAFTWEAEKLMFRALRVDTTLFEPIRHGEDPPLTAAVATRFGPTSSPDDAPGAGVICAAFSPPTDADLSVLADAAGAYGRMAGLCLGEDLTLRALLSSPGIDRLTGCLSHSAAVDAVESEVARCQRSGDLLSCCFVDLAGIAGLDGEQGRLEGSRVLVAVADALRRAVRNYDSVGRFGNNRFLIVLPETGGPQLQATARRIQKAVTDTHAAMTVAPLEISLGVAEWNGAGSAPELLEAADQARREAQRDGGGLVVQVRPNAPVGGLSALTEHLARAAGIAEKAALRARRNSDRSGDRP